MKTRSIAKSKKAKQKTVPQGISDPSLIQKAGSLEHKSPTPDYSAMYQAIEKISDPVSFESLKAFYGLQ